MFATRLRTIIAAMNAIRSLVFGLLVLVVFAAHAGTIDYEVLTNLGRRAFRRYIGG